MITCAKCRKPIFPEKGAVTWLGETYHGRCWGNSTKILVIAFVLCILASHALRSESSAPGMTCVSTARTVAFCYVDGASGTIPSWRVFDPESGEVFQGSEGLRAWVQADEKARVVEVVIPIGDTDYVKRCWLILSEGSPRLSAYANRLEVVTQAARPP